VPSAPSLVIYCVSYHEWIELYNGIALIERDSRGISIHKQGAGARAHEGARRENPARQGSVHQLSGLVERCLWGIGSQRPITVRKPAGTGGLGGAFRRRASAVRCSKRASWRDPDG
jgi:hypothetical protein